MDQSRALSAWRIEYWLIPTFWCTDSIRGEFFGLHGGADFYAIDIDVDNLKREGAASLQVCIDMCREDGAEPARPFSGKLDLRQSPGLHVEIAAEGKSLNRWTNDESRSSVADSP